MHRFISALMASVLVSIPIHAVTPATTHPLPADASKRDQYGDPLPDGAVARLGTMRFRPGNMQQSGLSPDGKWLATGNFDWRDSTGKEPARVKQWDMSSGLPAATIEIAGCNKINHLHFRTDSKQLAVVANRTWIHNQRAQRRTWICIIDVQSWKIVGQLSSEQLQDCHVADIAHFDPVKGMLMQTYRERQTGIVESREEEEDIEPKWTRLQRDPVMLWRPEKNEHFRLHDQQEQEEFFVAPEGRVFSLLDDQIRLLDPRTRQVLTEWKRPSPASFPACVSPDGKVLVALRPRAIRQPDKSVRKFCEVLLCEAGKAPRVIEECDNAWSLSEFAFTRDGRRLFAINQCVQVVAWNVDTGKRIWVAKEELAYSFCCDPAGKRIAIYTQGLLPGSKVFVPIIKILNAADGKLIAEQFSFGTNREWTPDGKRLVAIGESVRVLDADTLRDDFAQQFHGHACELSAIRVSPNQRWIATMDWPDNLCVWERATGRRVLPIEPREPERVRKFAFIDGTDLIATMSADERRVRIIQCESRRLILELPLSLLGRILPSITRSLLHDPPPIFSADGNRFAYQQKDSIHVWDNRDNKVMFACTAPTGETSEFRIAPAGDRLALYDSAEKVIRVVDVTTGQEFRSVRGVQWADFRFENVPLEMLLTVMMDESGKHSLIDLGAGRVLVDWTYDKGAWAISPDGRIIALGRDDVALIETATGKQIGTIAGQQSGITSLAFSADGRTLITGGRDTTGLVWDWPSACKLHKGKPRRVDEAWTQLCAEDAATVYSAMLALKDSPREALKLLRQKLTPVGAAETPRVHKWIGQLDDDSYSVRNEAERELCKHGWAVQTALEAALRRPSSAEAERRIRSILHSTGAYKPPPDEIRLLRAIQALEWIDSAEAKNLLREVSSGDSLSLATSAARSALQRIR